jgi:hypothetical protein
MSNLTQRLDDALSESEALAQQIQSDLAKIDTLLPTQRGDILASIDDSMTQLDAKLTRMAFDIRRLPMNVKEYFQSEVETLRGRHGQFAREIATKRLHVVSYTDSDAAQAAPRVAANLDEAIRLGQGQIQMNEQTQLVLLDDRARLECMHENLNVIDSDTTSGLVRANGMARRAFCNSIIAWIVVAVLAAVLIVLIVLKVKKIIH